MCSSYREKRDVEESRGGTRSVGPRTAAALPGPVLNSTFQRAPTGVTLVNSMVPSSCSRDQTVLPGERVAGVGGALRAARAARAADCSRLASFTELHPDPLGATLVYSM